MRKSLIAIFVAATIHSGRAQVQHPWPNVECSRVVDQASIIRPEEFRSDELVQLCQDFLKRYGRDRGLRRLLIATRQETVNSASFHGTQRITERTPTEPPSDSENAYNRTVAMIKYENLPHLPIARLIAIADAALLTVRDGPSYTERTLQGTSDPTLMRDGNTSYRLLHFWVTVPRTAADKDSYATSIFLKANPEVSASSVARMTRRLADVVGGGQISVVVRTDDFFPATWEYPAINPFVERLAVPTQLQFLVRGVLSCGFGTGREIGCSGTNFRP